MCLVLLVALRGHVSGAVSGTEEKKARFTANTQGLVVH